MDQILEMLEGLTLTVGAIAQVDPLWLFGQGNPPVVNIKLEVDRKKETPAVKPAAAPKAVPPVRRSTTKTRKPKK